MLRCEFKDVSNSVIESLPSYCTVDGSTVAIDAEFAVISNGRFFINASKMYPHYLRELNLSLDRFSIEVARRCMTEDLYRLTGPGLHIIITNPGRYLLEHLPERPGMTDSAARGSSEFRQFFNQLVALRRAKWRVD